jgi:hypothetical protein
MASGIPMLDLLHWASLADASSPTIFYWSQISPYVPDVLPFGLATLVLVAVVALEAIANRLYVRAVRDRAARGGIVAMMLLLGPLLGSPLAVLLCSITAVTLVFLQDLTSVPVGVLGAACAVVAAALLMTLIVRRTRQSQAPRIPLRLHVASVVGTALLTLGVIALFVLLAFSSLQSSYAHLTSAVYDGQRYHLAREDTFLERSTLHLYRCGTLGLLCQEVDSYGYHATVHGDLLQVDEYAGTVTARTDDGHLLFTYPLDGFSAA